MTRKPLHCLGYVPATLRFHWSYYPPHTGKPNDMKWKIEWKPRSEELAFRVMVPIASACPRPCYSSPGLVVADAAFHACCRSQALGHVGTVISVDLSTNGISTAERMQG